LYYELGKKIFKFFIETLNFFRVTLVFLSFFTVLYWFCQLAGATFVNIFAPFFETIKNITHLFYNRTIVIDKESIDFAFLIASFAMLFVVWALKFAVEYIEQAEKSYDNAHEIAKEKAEKIFNACLEQEYVNQEQKNKNIAILIKFSASNTLKDSFFDRNTDLGVEETQKTALLELLQNAESEEKLRFKKKVFDDSVLLSFDSFKDIDKILANIESYIENIRQKYAQNKWQINYFVGIEVYAKEHELESKIKSLMMLIKLGLTDKIICFATFKQRYSLLKKPKYKVDQEGLYSINDANEEVFYVKNLK